MAFPLGDVLRTFVKGGWLRRILDALKGTKITTPGGTDILLNQGQGGKVYPAGQSPFDSTPHKPEPPRVGPSIR